MSSDIELKDKEKRLFKLGVAAGILGGAMANLFISMTMKVLDLSGNQPAWAVILEFLIATVGFMGIILLLLRDINKS